MTTSNYLAVFDWNSTLFDDVQAMYQATNECLAVFDIAPMSLAEQQEIFSFPLIDFYEKAGIKTDDYLKNTQQLSDIFHTKYDELKKECSLMKGAYEALDFCSQNQMHMIILSNYNQEPLEKDVARFDLNPYFDAILGNQDYEAITSHTNKYERLRDYMKQHGFVPNKTFIIGDSHEEPELAHQLDILGISMAGGMLSPTRLEKYKKDYVIDDLAALIDILKREWEL